MRRQNPEQRRPGGHKVFVDIDDMTEDELRDTPREAFKDWEWDLLDEDLQEIIYQRDKVSQARIQGLIDLFTKTLEYVNDPEPEYVLDTVGDDYFSSWLREQADHLVDRAEQLGHSGEVEGLIETHREEGYTEEQIRQAIDEALQDDSNYDREVSDPYSEAFFKDGREEDQISIDPDSLKKALKGMFDDEIERACVEIDSETNGIFRPYGGPGRHGRRLDVGDLKETAAKYGIEANVSVEYFVAWEPDWSRIGRAVESALEGLEPEEAETEEARAEREAREALSLEERKVMVFPDGFYWLELIPSELKAEGARNDKGLSHCIGDAGPSGHGYPEALQKGWARAFSLRAPSGKRKLTLWADLTHSKAHAGKPTIRGISQVKGKSNRLPGWDLHKAGDGRLKEDEVKKTLTFVLDYLEFNAYDVPDLGPALRYMAQDPKLGPWLDEYDESINKTFGIGTVLPRAPVEANRLLARSRRDNPGRRRKRVCPTCGGEATGFCAPLEP